MLWNGTKGTHETVIMLITYAPVSRTIISQQKTDAGFHEDLVSRNLAWMSCRKDKWGNAGVMDKVYRWKTYGPRYRQKSPVIWSQMSDDRLVKTVMMGMMGDSRLHGRSTRRWSDDITEWCNCTFLEAVLISKYRVSPMNYQSYLFNINRVITDTFV